MKGDGTDKGCTQGTCVGVDGATSARGCKSVVCTLCMVAESIPRGGQGDGFGHVLVELSPCLLRALQGLDPAPTLLPARGKRVNTRTALNRLPVNTPCVPSPVIKKGDGVQRQYNATHTYVSAALNMSTSLVPVSSLNLRGSRLDGRTLAT